MRLTSLLTFLVHSAVAQTLPSINDVLPRVQKNLNEFVSALPNFTCTEQVISTRTAPGKSPKEARIESVFRGLQKKSAGYAFVESRDTISINGKLIPKDQQEDRKVPYGIFVFEGGFSSVLHETFAVENGVYQTFDIGGEEMLGNRNTWIITFETIDNQKTLAIGWAGKRVITKDRGKAWIDKETFQVLRVNRQYNGLPSKKTLNVTVDYAPVTIAAKQYFMPSVVRAEVTQTGSKPETSLYVAEYSNYKKFEVTSGIKY